MRKDYKNRDYLLETIRRPEHRHLRWAGLGLVLALLGVVMAKTNEPSPQTEVELEKALKQIELAIPNITPVDTETSPDARVTNSAPSDIEMTVASGDSLATVSGRAGVSYQDINTLVKTDKSLKRLHPGQTLVFRLDADMQLLRLRWQQNALEYIDYIKNDTGFSAEAGNIPQEKRTTFAQGIIEQSLFTAGKRSGISDSMIMDMAYVFGWDIDFALDVREGDRFSLIYEQIFQEGEFVREGKILAAEFVNQGDTYRAIRYTTEDGRADYFTADGKTLRKAFLRAPLNFTRISSRFTKRRYHPVLHKFRSHRGVDYAASRGTPVWSTGDGKIVFRGKKNGYGNTLVIQHGTRYTTLYAHLNGFARGLRVGRHVKQGQTIAYVGSTGLATGPHLHYEFRIQGTHRNPLKIKFPGVAPIAKKELATFTSNTASILAQLDSMSRVQVAQSSP